MIIYMGRNLKGEENNGSDPKAFVRELDRYIIGQADAKRCAPTQPLPQACWMKTQKELHLRIL